MLLVRATMPVLLMGAVCLQTHAQLIHTSVPLQNLSTGSFSGASVGGSVGGSVRGPHGFANFGGQNFAGQGPLQPPFGAVDPNAGFSGGIGFAGSGDSGSLRFNFAQSSSRSISSTTPSVTTLDGVPGSISAGVIRPFVTGFTPIVGDYGGAVAPLRSAAQASERRNRFQYRSLVNSQANLKNKKLQQYLRRGQRAESDGNKRMARANYRSAIALAPPPLRSQIQAHLKSMMKRSSTAGQR